MTCFRKWKTFSRNNFQAITYEGCGDKEHNPPEEEKLKIKAHVCQAILIYI